MPRLLGTRRRRQDLRAPDASRRRRVRAGQRDGRSRRLLDDFAYVRVDDAGGVADEHARAQEGPGRGRRVRVPRVGFPAAVVRLVARRDTGAARRHVALGRAGRRRRGNRNVAAPSRARRGPPRTIRVPAAPPRAIHVPAAAPPRRVSTERVPEHLGDVRGHPDPVTAQVVEAVDGDAATVAWTGGEAPYALQVADEADEPPCWKLAGDAARTVAVSRRRRGVAAARIGPVSSSSAASPPASDRSAGRPRRDAPSDDPTQRSARASSRVAAASPRVAAASSRVAVASSRVAAAAISRRRRVTSRHLAATRPRAL